MQHAHCNDRNSVLPVAFSGHAFIVSCSSIFFFFTFYSKSALMSRDYAAGVIYDSGTHDSLALTYERAMFYGAASLVRRVFFKWSDLC
jgi:hypothetical protein